MGVFDEFEQQRSSVFNTLPNTNNSIVFPSVFEEHSRNEGFYERGIDFDKLFKQIKAAAGGGSGFFHFDYKDFISTNKKTEIVFPTKMSLRPKVLEYLVDTPLEIEDDLGEVRQVQLTGKLNRSIAIVDVTTFYIRAIVKVNNGVPIYELYVMYKDAKNSRFRTDRHRVAFSIQAHTFNDFVAVYNEFNAEDNSFLEALVIKQFNKSFAAVGSDPDKLDWLYFYAPDVVLQNRPIEKRWKDLGVLLRHSVDEVGTNEELAVLSLLNSLVIDKRILTSEEDLQTNTVIQAIDHFLNELIRRKVTKGQTYFEILYEKLNNYGLGNDNFTVLLRLIYRYWLFSSYSSFDKPNNGLLPEVIAYQNNKVLGFFSDNYNFDFVKEQSQLKIKVTRLVPSEDVNDLRDKVASLTPRALKILGIDNVASFLPETLKPSGIARLDKLLFRTEVVGVYDIFQPIQIISTTTDSAGNEIALQQPHVVQGGITLPAMTIPAFYLKAFDDEKTWENIDKGVWLTLDIVTAITGVGNLLKLRHLRHLTKTAQVAKFLIGFVEVTAGVMSAMITLSDNCNEGTLTNDKELERRAKIAEALAEGKKPQKTFCESLKEYLFWAEIATLGADVFISRILKVKAKQTLDSADEFLDPAIRRHLEEVAGLAEGAGSKRYTLRSLDEDRIGRSINLRKYENEIRFSDTEKARFVNDKGSFLSNTITQDKNKFVNIPLWQINEAILKLKTGQKFILTHNHPTSTGISALDLKFLFYNEKLNQIRAVTREGNIFTVEKLNNLDIADFNSLAAKSATKVKNEYPEIVKKGRMRINNKLVYPEENLLLDQLLVDELMDSLIKQKTVKYIKYI